MPTTTNNNSSNSYAPIPNQTYSNYYHSALNTIKYRLSSLLCLICHLIKLSLSLPFKSNCSKLLFAFACITILYFITTPNSFINYYKTKTQSLSNDYVGTLTSSLCGRHSANDALDLPTVEYGIMIDAGSTGSRIHIYRFNHCTSRTPMVEHEIFEQITPGLSSFASNPALAAQSLAPLLDIALQAIPKIYHSCSTIQVKATAGLRLLGSNVSNSILINVRAFISSNYPFVLLDSERGKNDAVSIMDGQNEGVFAWVTVNSLLNSKKQTNSNTQSTAAVIDLGGASTQIVFSPVINKNIPLNNRADIAFGGSKHVLYQHSYLGYGLKEALKSIQRAIVNRSNHDINSSVPINHPCYPAGYSKSVDVLSATITGQPHPNMCTKVVQDALFPNLLQTDTRSPPNLPICEISPCAMQGQYHPDIPNESAIFAFSYFYDLLKPVLSVAHAYPETVPGDHHGQDDVEEKDTHLGKEMVRSSTNLKELQVIQQLACYSPLAIDENAGLAGHPVRGIVSDLVHEDPDYCASITYIIQLLKSYRIGISRLITVVKKVQGYELGWCLGATMSMLDTADRVGKRCRRV